MKTVLPKRVIFDASNHEHLRLADEFVRNKGWRGFCPFILEGSYYNIPSMITRKINAHSLATNDQTN